MSSGIDTNEAAAATTANAHRRPPAVRAAGLSKAFGTRVALRDLTFEIAPGERVAVLGPNGAGKSTLLRLLALLSTPTAGMLEIDGLSVPQDGNAIRARTGALLHESLLYADLSVHENLAFFARLYRTKISCDRSQALIERLDLTAQAGLRVKQLSRGQRQRASLARALVHDPSLLLLDEPDTGQDPVSLQYVEQELLSDAGRTLIFSTHQTAHALAVATRIFVLANGSGYDLGPAGRLTSADLQATLAEAGA